MQIGYVLLFDMEQSSTRIHRMNSGAAPPMQC